MPECECTSNYPENEVQPQRACAVGLCALAAALVARRGRAKSAASRVIMQVRKPTRWAKPAAKGMKPMIQRKETRLDEEQGQEPGFHGEGWVS
eukprot:Skav213962  [mRNA]  locus=scaffold5525:24942:27463:- [translate_table: standard]